MDQHFITVEDFLDRLNAILDKFEQAQTKKAALNKDFVGTKEALRLLELSSPKSLLKLYRNGIIGRSKIGGRYFYSRAEISNVLERNYKKVNFKF